MNTKKRAVLNGLAGGATIKEAAKTANVGIRTVYNWLHDDNEFQQALDRIQSSTIDDIVSYFMACQETAQTTVLEIMNNSDTPPATRLKAAEMILDRAVQFYELKNIDRRLSSVEASQSQE